MVNMYGCDKPVSGGRYLAAFLGQRTCAGLRFFAFGVKGAGGEVSKRLSASSARFNAASSTGGRASFFGGAFISGRG